MWDTVITYSSDNEIGYNLIKSTLHRVLSSGNLGKLPPVTFSCKILDTNCESEVQNEPLLMIPKGFLDTTKDEKSPLSNFMNSEELCGVFSIPTENIVGFEIQEIKRVTLCCPDSVTILPWIASLSGAYSDVLLIEYFFYLEDVPLSNILTIENSVKQIAPRPTKTRAGMK